MFERKVETLKKILNHLDDEFFKTINGDKKLYYACRGDYITIYYNGLVWAKVGPKSINLSKEIKDRIKKFESSDLPFADKLNYFLKNSEIIKSEIDKTEFTKKQIERNNETKLASKFGFSEEVAVIDIEATIPKNEKIINKKTEKYKKAEIDMVIYDTKRKILYLTEYKCKESSMKNASGVIEHYLDMKQVIEKCKENFVRAEIDVYNMRANKKVNYNGVEVRIALCFSNIDAYKISNVLKNIDKKDDIYVWFGETLDNVDFGKEPETVSGFITKYVK